MAGAACLALGALLSTVSRSAFDPVAFGDRAAASLADPRVASYAADRVTAAVLSQSPDLTPVRPLLRAAAEGLVGTEPFQAVVRTAARSAHAALFAEGTHRVVLSVPDVGVLLRSLLERASPELAERIPAQLQAAVEAPALWRGGGIVLDLWELRNQLRRLVLPFLLLGASLLALGAGLAKPRVRGLIAAGGALLAVGLSLAALRSLGSAAVLRLSPDPSAGPALAGLWDTFLAELYDWGLLLGGLGVLVSAAATSLLADEVPLAWLRRAARAVATHPATTRGRLAFGLGLLAAGAVAVRAPDLLLRAAVVVAGVAAAYLGIRELFALVLGAAENSEAALRVARGRTTLLRSAITVAGVALAALLWIVWESPVDAKSPTSVTACNGHAALCARRVDEVAFAGTHNAMSHIDTPDWMFPHHEAGIPRQLEDGVRALMIDVHYGFPGASRIKTDLEAERPTTEQLEHALGPEGIEAALRIRRTLVGVDEGRRELFLCHGFCEKGARELLPDLRAIRAFLLQHPGEVLILVVEDYVPPESLWEAFEESRLADFVYRGPSGPPWPTLGRLVASGQNVLVLIESGREGVPWLRPAFELMQETPFTFREPAEFSCRANRGGDGGSLFQLNHWIETTPTPLPSNARIVNARDVLLGRARQCQRERGLLPNVLAVDFYRTGDLFDVVDELNGVAQPEQNPTGTRAGAG